MIDAISNALAEPNLVFGLYVVGTLAILYEVFKPGSIFPGVAGGAMVVGAILASRALPVRPFTVLGIALGLGLVTAEVYVRSRGVLALVGFVVLLTSGLHLINLHLNLHGASIPEPASPVVVLVGSLVATLAILIGGRRIVDHESSAAGTPVRTIGRSGTWRGKGIVALDDSIWRGEAASAIAPGSPVIVTGARGFVLTVTALNGTKPQAQPSRHS
ncbi:MAG: hypothetical protein HYY84_09570 [Deltaproteobacteria bacterium]|nr:hypothetical protein [Deltaproteobacteria bacterium]